MLTVTTNKMPEYIYMQLPDGRADVFIYKFVGESEDGESYEYESNEFRTSKLSEADIASNPLRYLGYSEREQTLEEKLKEIEVLKEQNQMLIDCILEMADIIYA